MAEFKELEKNIEAVEEMVFTLNSYTSNYQNTF